MGTGSSYGMRRRYRIARYVLHALGIVALVAFIRSHNGGQPTYEEKGTVGKMLDKLPKLPVSAKLLPEHQ